MPAPHAQLSRGDGALALMEGERGSVMIGQQFRRVVFVVKELELGDNAEMEAGDESGNADYPAAPHDDGREQAMFEDALPESVDLLLVGRREVCGCDGRLLVG